MRILFLANDDEGLYKFRKELIERLLKDNEVFVSLPYGKYVENLKEMGCTYIQTEFERKGTNPIKDIKLISFYKKIINNTKADVVLTYTVKPNVYGGLACQITNTKYLVNITGLGSALENPGILQKILVVLYKLGLRKANKVFFQNETNRDFMIEKNIIDRYRTTIIPGSGVNLDEYKLLDYPNGNITDFVYIGRIMKEKGFDQYIDAAKYIKSIYSNTRFHICGTYEDDYKNEVEQLVAEDVVIYHGSVENMLDIYSIIQCTIHPTYYPEGLSNVLLESLACGRPIITTDRPGCKEVIVDGVNGFVVKQKDSKDLIRKIEKFLSLSTKERKRLGLNGRQKVETEFDRNIVIDTYLEEIYK
ncbi:MAG: glycosyltransferase family 4 protein [Erysipelotrichaceae bacterium]|nr:glycosyltransferase family 4 protein [Erysipelotrichaceae bacterium]